MGNVVIYAEVTPLDSFAANRFASSLLLQVPRTVALAVFLVHGGTGQRLVRKSRECAMNPES